MRFDFRNPNILKNKYIFKIECKINVEKIESKNEVKIECKKGI